MPEEDDGGTGGGLQLLVVLPAVIAVLVLFVMLALCADKRVPEKKPMLHSVTTGTTGASSLTGSRFSPHQPEGVRPYSPMPPGLPGAQYGQPQPVYGPIPPEPEPGVPLRVQSASSHLQNINAT